MIDVTVKIPEDRVSAFYSLVGRWLAGDLDEDGPEPATIKPSEWTDSEADLPLARTVWEKFSPRAKAVFSLLMEKPGEKVSAEDLASKLDIPNGKYGVAGVMAWPGRHCAAVNRTLPFSYEDGPVGAGAQYWMNAEVAALFSRV